MVLDNSTEVHLYKTGRPSIWTKMIQPFPPFCTLAQERPHQACAQAGQQGRVAPHLASVSVSPLPVKAKCDGASPGSALPLSQHLFTVSRIKINNTHFILQHYLF